eukprot:5996762-Ditylum_brightwellii.AAC.1
MLGVNEDFCQHCQAFPMYGTGQGNTKSPTNWLINSSTLFDINEELGKGVSLSNPLQTIHAHITMVGFVDDATVQNNEFYNDHIAPEKLIELMQHDDQLWSDLLWLSERLL